MLTLKIASLSQSVLATVHAQVYQAMTSFILVGVKLIMIVDIGRTHAWFCLKTAQKEFLSARPLVYLLRLLIGSLAHPFYSWASEGETVKWANDDQSQASFPRHFYPQCVAGALYWQTRHDFLCYRSNTICQLKAQRYLSTLLTFPGSRRESLTAKSLTIC